MFIRSITPLKCYPCPRGIWNTRGSIFKNLSIDWAVRKTDEPMRSNLLMKQILGIFRLEACSQTLTVWDSTPLPPSKIVTAPSRTFKLLATYPEKSTWPGVSIRLIWHLLQLKLMAADLMVIPLSLYCFI